MSTIRKITERDTFGGSILFGSIGKPPRSGPNKVRWFRYNQIEWAHCAKKGGTAAY